MIKNYHQTWKTKQINLLGISLYETNLNIVYI
jgi:hypothetical protein